ncbi:hypothetical protein WJX79_003670 [Trebouxia sp. C0005]
MEVERQLDMSLDDIIAKQKKARPVGGKKQTARAGQQSKQSPKVFNGPQGTRKSTQLVRFAQTGNKSAAARKQGSQKSPGFAMRRRPTQNGAIAKPGRKGPNAQSNKGKQSGAPKVLVGTPGIKAPKSISSREEPLKITISNDRTQRINLPRPQARPVLPMPQTQLTMPAQAQTPRARSAVHVTSAYAPAAQQIQRDSPVAAPPVRPTYQEPVGRSLNQAATYLRDPYRGDDFERSIVGGMRSDVSTYGNRTQRDTRAYDSMLDDSLREDDYTGRAYSRNNRAYRR